MASMDERCSFCQIASGHHEAAVVHDDPFVMAFMDRRPIRPGHVLVMPRAHSPDLFDLPAPDYSQVLGVAQRLAKALQRTFHPERVGMVVAGFDVPHAHVHLIPMLEYHDITSRSLLDGTLHQAAHSELEVSAATLRAELARTQSDTS